MSTPRTHRILMINGPINFFKQHFCGLKSLGFFFFSHTGNYRFQNIGCLNCFLRLLFSLQNLKIKKQTRQFSISANFFGSEKKTCPQNQSQKLGLDWLSWLPSRDEGSSSFSGGWRMRERCKIKFQDMVIPDALCRELLIIIYKFIPPCSCGHFSPFM